MQKATLKSRRSTEQLVKWVHPLWCGYIYLVNNLKIFSTITQIIYEECGGYYEKH